MYAYPSHKQQAMTSNSRVATMQPSSNERLISPRLSLLCGLVAIDN
jgi:hypothetical protein